MTEHSAAIFVFFFLAEYASIILMCILISITLLGGYEIFSLFYFVQQNIDRLVSIFVKILGIIVNFNLNNEINLLYIKYVNIIINNNLYFSLINTIILSIKSLILIFAFI
jgi:NADH-ubiquinone oxidoreductase chain 1